MWEVLPDSNYVANPAKGSRHNRGAAVDLTLVDRNGKELEMPTGFDDFTERAHRNYSGGSAQALKNRQLLEDVMKKYGFIPLATEWWHFDAPGWDKFSILDVPFGAIP
jgi:D-alanyl-D-alanine dipeptidase